MSSIQLLSGGELRDLESKLNADGIRNIRMHSHMQLQPHTCIHIYIYTHVRAAISAQSSIHRMTYAQIPNASISLIIYRGVFYCVGACIDVRCVYACIYMCIKFLIHNTYRLRLLIVPYVKASPNWTSQVLSVNELLPNYHGILAHKYTHTHTCSHSLSLFAFSSL